MSAYRIKKGFDVPLEGKPAGNIASAPAGKTVALQPLEFTGIKQRVVVKEGDAVKRGDVLIEDKRNEAFKLRAPAAGTIQEIRRGHRRFVEQVIIACDDGGGAESFKSYPEGVLLSAKAGELLDQLVSTGYLMFLKQRPFSVMADPQVRPKAIFVNAMNTAPFQADAGVVAGDDPEGLQAGLNVLTRLTDGAVHLCVGEEATPALLNARNVQVHRFSGPHPAGNTSVHISRIDPLAPTDVIWTIRAVDLVLIGRLFLDGKLPETRVIALGGPGLRADARRHVRVQIGAELKPVLAGAICEVDPRIISGDVLTGSATSPEGWFGLGQSSLTVVREGHERRFLGWTSPGFKLLSFTRTVVSSFLGGHARKWQLGTNRNGSVRAPILTCHYDRVMPLNIMVDFLVRAVMAGDTEEAIQLGILETDPEDFALCDFICPSKIEVQELIREGLEQIREEGI